MKLKADITEFLDKNIILANKSKITVSKRTTVVQFDKGLEK